MSLVELLIGITVATIAGMLAVNLMVSSNELFFNQSNQIRQGLSSNDAAREITTAIKSSSGISTQYPPSGTAQFITGPEVLVLKLPAINQSGSIIDQVLDYVVISKDSSSPKILRKYIFVDGTSVRKAENKVLSTALSGLSFDYIDAVGNQVAANEAVRIGFTINLSENTSTPESQSTTSSIVNLKD